MVLLYLCKKTDFLIVEYNISRLYYLLDLYKMSIDELLVSISDGLKKPISKEEILKEEIKLSYLKKIDSIFNKGINFYLDPKNPEKSKESSIFFRKGSFNSELNIGAKKAVNHFEEFKISLSAIAKLSDINLSRKTPVFSIRKNAKEVANQVRIALYPSFATDKKEFLKLLISKFADSNILVLEFVETWNKKEKANIDGFFLSPNAIILKRQQSALRREIFTLVHELGHYLLNEEEIESLDYNDLLNNNLSLIERWCNDFAFYFLAGKHSELIDKIEFVNSSNDYYLDLITEISDQTHLSRIAIYTRLLLNKKISHQDYNYIKQDFDDKYKNREAEIKKQRELDKLNGIPQRGAAPKPIISPLLTSTIQTAYYEGIISEYEVCKKLNIKPEKFKNYIQ